MSRGWTTKSTLISSLIFVAVSGTSFTVKSFWSSVRNHAASWPAPPCPCAPASDWPAGRRAAARSSPRSSGRGIYHSGNRARNVVLQQPFAARVQPGNRHLFIEHADHQTQVNLVPPKAVVAWPWMPFNRAESSASESGLGSNFSTTIFPLAACLYSPSRSSTRCA